ncbi:hypothetical protein PDUR_01015 [Paenibacillus durus]|uniref:Uncharacterized protein n=1 Tax=Paenibacillus durus TaxID=44251 RepID=A0A089HJA3_PAEDU|nr:hypothetical protein PDUR_01015 [Paenibacillus durus]
MAVNRPLRTVLTAARDKLWLCTSTPQLHMEMKRHLEGNVIKISSKIRLGIKMESKTAWGKALCRLFFGASQKKCTANKAEGISA